jgi:hypothetical protein
VATYDVPAGTSTITETLTANAADNVTFADRVGFVSIVNTGATVLYARSDGTAATVGGQGCIAVAVGSTAVLANSGIYWNQSSKVIPQSANQFGGGNTASSPSSPGIVTPMESLRGQMANPGTVVSIISSGADSYTLALTG